jgi:hypothetical protein
MSIRMRRTREKAKILNNNNNNNSYIAADHARYIDGVQRSEAVLLPERGVSKHGGNGAVEIVRGALNAPAQSAYMRMIVTSVPYDNVLLPRGHRGHLQLLRRGDPPLHLSTSAAMHAP